jgi:hypothetical protein
MKKNVVTTLLGLGIAILLVASLGLAKAHPITKTIQILNPTKIGGGTMLQPGVYRVELQANSQSPELGFYQSGKQVAEVPVKLAPSQTKNSETEVLIDTASNTPVITEIDFRGSDQRMVLENSRSDK